MSACGCSTRTPTAKGFGSRETPRRTRSAKTSRAECPVARMTARASTRSPSAVTTPAISPLASRRSATRVPKRTSPPAPTIVSRSASTTRGRRFVPTCGCASIRMSAGAPCWTRTSSTRRDLAPLGRARVELAVGERARAALAEAVVAVRVDDALAVEPRDVEPPAAHVAPALEHDRAEAALDERERREEPGGSRAHDDRRPAPRTSRQRRDGAGAARAPRRPRRGHGGPRAAVADAHRASAGRPSRG